MVAVFKNQGWRQSCSDPDTSIGNAANTAEIAGISMDEYATLCTDQRPCLLLAVINSTQLLSSKLS